MTAPTFDATIRDRLHGLIQKHSNVSAVARALGWNRSTLARKLLAPELPSSRELRCSDVDAVLFVLGLDPATAMRVTRRLQKPRQDDEPTQAATEAPEPATTQPEPGAVPARDPEAPDPEEVQRTLRWLSDIVLTKREAVEAYGSRMIGYLLGQELITEGEGDYYVVEG